MNTTPKLNYTRDEVIRLVEGQRHTKADASEFSRGYDFAIDSILDELNPCSACNGTGLDPGHHWPDGSQAHCETCDGYGKINPNTNEA